MGFVPGRDTLFSCAPDLIGGTVVHSCGQKTIATMYNLRASSVHDVKTCNRRESCTVRFSNSQTELRQSFIFTQTLVGAVAVAVWMGVGMLVLDEDAPTAFVKVLPFVVIYELGVFSRYFPGVRQTARTLEVWTRGRRRV
jgi:hypothetical protein